MRPQTVRALAERAYPHLLPSGYCSRVHSSEDEMARCTVCFPDLRALIDAHNDLKQKAWAAIADVQVEMTHGATANWEFIERRLREGYGGDQETAPSAPKGQRDE